MKMRRQMKDDTRDQQADAMCTNVDHAVLNLVNMEEARAKGSLSNAQDNDMIMTGCQPQRANAAPISHQP